MNIEMFIHFPGILITIGVGLLLASLIFGLIAYKKEKSEVGADLLSNEIPSPEEFDEKPPIKREEPIITEEKEEEASTFTFPKDEEIEEIKTGSIPIINETNNNEITPEETVTEERIEPIINEPIKEEQPAIKETPIKEEQPAIEETPIKDNTVIEAVPQMKEEPITEVNPVEEKTTRIYGGIEPTKQFNFTFNKEKGMYEDSKKPLYNIGESLNSQKIEIEQPTIEKTQTKEEPKVLNNIMNSEEDEDIEVL